jgi:hypothetical protein
VKTEAAGKLYRRACGRHALCDLGRASES